jgi:hypothetical protein
MDAETRFQLQKATAEQGLLLLRKLLPLVGPIGKYEGWTKEERDTLRLLLTATARSSESVMLLSAWGQLWDAEVVLRSVSEGSMKLAFLWQDKNQFKQRYAEYSDALLQIGMLKKHGKAQDFLRAVSNPEDPEWAPLRELLMTQEQISAITGKYDKAGRRALESKWGFAGILGALRRSGDPFYARILGFTHGYSVASNIQHADYIGVSMPWDRELRQENTQDEMHFSHLARIISDTLTFLFIRLSTGYRYIDENTFPLSEALSEIEAVTEKNKRLYEEWLKFSAQKS